MGVKEHTLVMIILEKGFHEDWRVDRGVVIVGFEDRKINIYNRYIDMGSFEIGQRLEIFIFRGVG